MHKLTGSVNNKADIWSRKCEILKSTHNLTKPCRIRKQGISPARVNSVLHCSHATWIVEACQGWSRRKKKGRRADLWWLLSLAELLEATGSYAGGSWWSALALFFFLLSLSLFFVLFSASFSFFFFSFGSPPLFCSLSSLLLSFSLSLHFALSSLVFIGKKQGRKRTGWPLCCRPSTAPQHVENFG